MPPAGGDFFPVSLGYIAARLKHAGIEAMIEDMTVDPPRSLDHISALIQGFKPAIVGFSAYQWNMQPILALSDFIKQIDPAIKIIIGGPQATFMPKEALLQMPSVDIVCRQEGETVLLELCRCLEAKQSIQGVKGILFRKDGGLAENARVVLAADLDHLPSPYQNNVFNFRDHKIAAMLASRGCTFNCSFCYTPKAFGRRISSHSAQRVLDDIAVCLKHGLREFFFCDPSFTFDKSRVSQIMQGIKKQGWKIKIWCTTRTDLVDRELLTKMAQGGVKTIAYGLEAADPVVLRAVNKKLNLKQFAKTVKLTQALGIQVEVYSMYCLPRQTYASACATLSFLKDLNIKIFGNSFGQQTCLYFGTALFDAPEKFRIKVIADKGRPDFLSAGFGFETSQMLKKQVSLMGKHYQNQNLLYNLEKHKKSRQGLNSLFASNYSTGNLSYDFSKVLF